MTDAVDAAVDQAGSAGFAETPAYAPWSGHVPAPEHRTPVTTYRLQLGEDLTFADAKALVPYLADLGVTDLYLSPILTAAPGSTHGYDVVDHRRVSAIMGGREQLESLAAEADAHGMGVVVDIVPNHMAVPTPGWHNLPLWSVLREGPDSPYAAWFDLSLDEPILMPILGKRIGAVLADEELTLEQMVVPGQEDLGEQWVLRYYDHAFPVAQGTESLPMHVLVDRQHYRLAYWKVGDEEINYRRFFDVGTLAAIRVEEPDVFAGSHGLILDLMRDGVISALRVDHPDGLADPGGYLTQLAEATSGAWIAAEKILAPDESLPTSWPVAGTTGYDAAWRIDQLQVDPAGAARLGALMQELTGDAPVDYDRVVEEAKREVIAGSLAAEVDRLARILDCLTSQDVRLRDHTLRDLRACVVELLVAADQYRVYVVPGTPPGPETAAVLQADAERARQRLEPDQGETLDLVVAILLGEPVGSEGLSESPERAEAIIRFQQVCGAVTAKGVEDTAFYRWTHLTSLTEVGGNPAGFALSADEAHAWADRVQNIWPDTMVTSTTHDTKRGEDVRARLDVLASYAEEWSNLIHRLRHDRTGPPPGPRRAQREPAVADPVGDLGARQRRPHDLRAPERLSHQGLPGAEDLDHLDRPGPGSGTGPDRLRHPPAHQRGGPRRARGLRGPDGQVRAHRDPRRQGAVADLDGGQRHLPGQRDHPHLTGGPRQPSRGRLRRALGPHQRPGAPRLRSRTAQPG